MSHPDPRADLDNMYPEDDFSKVTIGNNGEEQTENDDKQRMGFIGFPLLLIGAIGLAIVFPPLWLVYLIIIGISLIDNRNR